MIRRANIPVSGFVLQDRKRLPNRFDAHRAGSALARLA